MQPTAAKTPAITPLSLRILGLLVILLAAALIVITALGGSTFGFSPVKLALTDWIWNPSLERPDQRIMALGLASMPVLALAAYARKYRALLCASACFLMACVPMILTGPFFVPVALILLAAATAFLIFDRPVPRSLITVVLVNLPLLAYIANLPNYVLHFG